MVYIEISNADVEVIMRARELTMLLRKLAKLTPSQRQRVAMELVTVERKTTAASVIETNVPHHGCPHCHGERVVKNGIVSGMQRFKCRSCLKTFNALTGTPLAHLHLRDKWLDQTAALRDGLSLKQVEARLGVAHATAFAGAIDSSLPPSP
jgi:transposase-like protein